LRHLNLELEKLEQRIAPGGVPTPGSKSSKSGSKSGKSNGTKSAKSNGSKSGSK